MVGTSSPAPCSEPSISLESAWAQRQSAAARAVLVDEFTPLVRRLAGRVFRRRSGDELQFSDLVQFGVVGLLEAIDRYDPGQGIPFEGFAIPRIQGAMLNGLATYSERQSQLAFRRKLMKERSASLRTPHEAVARSALDRLADLAIGLALGFTLESSTPDEEPEAASPDNAYVRVEMAQLRRELSELVQQLSENERRVVVRHYFQHQTFDEIARGMLLSNGRISQLHRSALNHLRAALRRRHGAGYG